jgi:hypothetical protein
MRASLLGVGAAAIVSLAAPTACAQRAHNAQTAPNVPIRDSFRGHVKTATRSLSHDQGAVGIDLAHLGSNRIRLTFRGRGCGATNHCLQPSGTLTGTMMQASHRVPDTGTSFAIKASGKLKPLGHVSATGTAQGTGFIARGYTSMQLTLTAGHGTVTYEAQAGPVGGFTSP